MLAGGSKQEAAKIRDAADARRASRGSRQACALRAATGLGVVNAPRVDEMVNYDAMWEPTDQQAQLVDAFLLARLPFQN